MKEFIRKKKSINCKGVLLSFEKPVVMGILNLTPDSFYDGGFYNSKNKIKDRIKQIIHEGAEIIDIGAYSSRPGAKHISAKEELQRLIPALELILKYFPDTIVSVDTFRSDIAQTLIQNYGVSIINDISAGTLDEKMFDTIAQNNIPYIIMHMKGNPQNMQNNTQYDNMIMEIIHYFTEKIHYLKNMGINDIIIDPGFGFSKTLEQNYQLLKKFKSFDLLELPVLAGISRKSMIYKYLNIKPEDAQNGTSVLNTIALQNGADILRVHNVKEAVEAIKLVELIK